MSSRENDSVSAQSRRRLLLAAGPTPNTDERKKMESSAEPEYDAEVLYEKLCFFDE